MGFLGVGAEASALWQHFCDCCHTQHPHHSLPYLTPPRVLCSGPWVPEKQSLLLTSTLVRGGGSEDSHCALGPPSDTTPHCLPAEAATLLTDGPHRGWPGGQTCLWLGSGVGGLVLIAPRETLGAACMARAWPSGALIAGGFVPSLSFAVGLCSPPRFGFNRCQGLRWAEMGKHIHPGTAATPQHCSSKSGRASAQPIGHTSRRAQ